MPPAESTEIEQWLKQLDAERVTLRDTAVRQLVAVGPAAVEPLRRHVEQGSLESIARGIEALYRLSLEPNAAAFAAEEAIRELAQHRTGSASSAARGALASLVALHSTRAVRVLKQLGATVQEGSAANGTSQILTVTIGNGWRGKVTDLQYLQWLTDFRGIHLTLSGPQIDDEWLQKLPSKERVISLQLSRTSITDDGLRHLPDFRMLQSLSLKYSPFTDASLPWIEQGASDTLMQIMVYGTKITKLALAQTAQSMNLQQVTHRQGGFLGIGGEGVAGVGCRVTLVQPNEAAARAGIQPGDIVTHYRDIRVTRFSPIEQSNLPQDEQVTLSELIGQDEVDSKVAIRIRRGPQELEKEVTLGEWP